MESFFYSSELIDIFLQKNGLRIGPYDTQIAGHARALKMILVSNNLKEFNQVPDLTLENWAEEQYLERRS